MVHFKQPYAQSDKAAKSDHKASCLKRLAIMTIEIHVGGDLLHGHEIFQKVWDRCTVVPVKIVAFKG